MQDFLVIDIETVPVDIAASKLLTEEERKKKLNPIDSKIVAIGLMSAHETWVQSGEDEAALLTELWTRWDLFRRANPGAPIVGFNHASFDIPFLVTRSFLCNVPIIPFSTRQLVDIRHKLAAYAYGEQRGKLKELAQLTGHEVLDVDGSDVTRLWEEDREKLEEYLAKDLQITRSLYERMVRLGIDKIQRF